MGAGRSRAQGNSRRSCVGPRAGAGHSLQRAVRLVADRSQTRGAGLQQLRLPLYHAVAAQQRGRAGLQRLRTLLQAARDQQVPTYRHYLITYLPTSLWHNLVYTYLHPTLYHYSNSHLTIGSFIRDCFNTREEKNPLDIPFVLSYDFSMRDLKVSYR